MQGVWHLVMVEKNALDSSSSPLLQKMLVLLTDLPEFSQNDVFVNHIKHALIEWDAIQNGTIDAYADFIKALLDACAANLPDDSLLTRHIKLVKTCLTPPISEHELAMLSECIDHAAGLLHRSTLLDPILDAERGAINRARAINPIAQEMAIDNNAKFPQPTSKTAKKGKFYGPIKRDGAYAINVAPQSGDAGPASFSDMSAILNNPLLEYGVDSAAKMQLVHFEDEKGAAALNADGPEKQRFRKPSDSDGYNIQAQQGCNQQTIDPSVTSGDCYNVGTRGIFNKPSPLGQHAIFSGDADARLLKEPDEKLERSKKSYYLHVDEQRNEMERLYSTLVLEMRATIAETSAFGVDLGLEIAALQEAPTHHDVDKRRSEVLSSLMKLSAEHTALARKLDTVREFLSILKSGNQKLNDELDRARMLSLTDELTSLPNRRAFIRRLDDEVSRARRYGVTLSLVLIDIDNFKHVNDQHGHSAGDAVLRVYAKKILSIFRHHDMIARYGGEEFAVLLPNTDLDGVMRALLKVKHQVPQTECDVNGVGIQVPTFSAGIAEYRQSESSAQLIERADVALYRAKRQGRNRIESELPLSEKA